MARNTHILHVPVISQKTDHECGNTVLTSVLQYLGKRCSVKEVYEWSNTTKDGTDHKDMIAGGVNAGATVFARSGGGHKALREVLEIVSYGIPVICGWWSMGPREKFGDVGVDYDKNWDLKKKIDGDCGHYSVLRGYTPSTPVS